MNKSWTYIATKEKLYLYTCEITAYWNTQIVDEYSNQKHHNCVSPSQSDTVRSAALSLNQSRSLQLPAWPLNRPDRMESWTGSFPWLAHHKPPPTPTPPPVLQMARPFPQSYAIIHKTPANTFQLLAENTKERIEMTFRNNALCGQKVFEFVQEAKRDCKVAVMRWVWDLYLYSPRLNSKKWKGLWLNSTWTSYVHTSLCATPTRFGCCSYPYSRSPW